MRNLEYLRSIPVDDLRLAIRKMRTDVRTLDRLKSESGTPKATVEKFRKAVGVNRANEVVASLINHVAWDGRICRVSRDWAKRVDGAWTEDAMSEWCIDTTMHRAHLDQIACEMSRA